MPDVRNIIADLLEQRTPVAFQAFGPSMHPTIRSGETVRIQPLAESDIRPGALLLHRLHGRLALHRLIRRDRRTGWLLLAADAATDGGDWVDPADLLGTAEWVRRGEQCRRLNGPICRLAGLIRHALRPWRRAFLRVRIHSHAHTPGPRP